MPSRRQYQQHAAQTALVFSGGGARAAYQVGVLKGIALLHAQQTAVFKPSPFGILVGTSAGAINLAALASGADDFEAAVARLEKTWASLTVDQVYRADSWSLIRTGARWLSLLSLGWALARWGRSQPQALLDNAPLASLLQQHIDLDRIPALIASGHLHSVAVSAFSYTSGRHITFYDSAARPQPWQRTQRLAAHTQLHYNHLLASAAIPFVFPAQAVAMPEGDAFFGDGSMRHAAPMAPAIHLGARRILVIGASRASPVSAAPTPDYVAAPSLAQIAGHALSSIFHDGLATDIERLTRINHTLSLMSPEQIAQSGLHSIESLVITPSQNIDHLAAQHMHHLPASIRALLGALGTNQDAKQLGQSALLSYLLFEAPFTQALMALGMQDTLQRSQEICAFLGWQWPEAIPAAQDSTPA
ncbi:patatin-like phospholipase family protein [Lampropedia puyangensis]|uniref:Patatin-like phospholipase family protein n=1 Tax=Lampropedia puyangensis TaxID=1330072 RepID=A0A4S8FBB7_9BURK|nr:patatin-like phospholipase family protein [Lampropedia puyangensis]THU04115.1 patatin-like phospholipase family protein [Lampropedia puyangensis]